MALGYLKLDQNELIEEKGDTIWQRILLVTSPGQKIGVMHQINVLFKKQDGGWFKFKRREWEQIRMTVSLSVLGLGVR